MIISLGFLVVCLVGLCMGWMLTYLSWSADLDELVRRGRSAGNRLPEEVQELVRRRLVRAASEALARLLLADLHDFHVTWVG
jgi:hypothetical protein